MTKTKLFGTDGVRGKANEYPMTIDFAQKLGMATGKMICKKHFKAAIAKDTRISGDMLEAALIAGLTSQGVDVIKLGVLPTPALTTLTKQLNVDMAVMITASHNPFTDNGLKLISSDGSKFSDETTSLIEKAINETTFSYEKDKIGKVFEDYSLIQKYKDIALKMKKETKPLQGLNVVLDCANGCFFEILPEIFSNFGANITVLSNTPNGKNINLNCGSQHTEQLCTTVIKTNADIGIAVDGDGDRIIICDELGNRINGDQIIAFLGLYYHQKNMLSTNSVVATIVSNPALDSFLQKKGIKCYRSAVGERYVIDEMKKYGSNIGGEESGHMVISDYAKTGDALMAALIVALGLKESGKKMSQIFPLFTPMAKVRIDAKFANNNMMNDAFEDNNFKKAIECCEQKIKDEGKILIRKSGTEPKIQVWVWADNKDFAKEINLEMIKNLENCSGFEELKTIS